MLRSLNLLEFHSTYLSLANLLARLRHSTRTQVAFATPPGKTTIPQDPNLSGGSTSSGSSTESKPEPYAQDVATQFLRATYSTVTKWMRRLEWVNPDAKLYLYPQYVAILFIFFRLIILALSNKWKYVSAKRNWSKQLMTVVFPCTFDAIQYQANFRDE